MAIKISDHFTWEELTTTSHRQFDNTPSAEEAQNLSLLANEQLEAVRAVWGCGVHVNSGYRSPEVNAAVGGSPTSQHTKGCAADIVPLGQMSLKEAFEKILKEGIVFDQLIYECPRKGGGWIHISRPAHGGTYRRQALMYGYFTNKKYEVYDADSIP